MKVIPASDQRQKISTKLILYVILFSSMITAIVTLVQLYYQYVEEKTILDTNIKNINTGYRESITNAVWLDDKVQLDSILDGVVALPDIEYIEVRVNNEIYSSRGRIVESNALSSSFPLLYRHNNKMLVIGETFVVADLTAIYRRVINHAWTILGLNAIKTTIVALFMYFIFNKLVVSRLESISNFLRRYDIHDINDGSKLEPLVDDKYSDEISEIATALNTMHSQLSLSVKELLGLKQTLDLSLDGVFIFYPDTYRIFYANAGAVALLGYTAEEIVQLTPMDLSNDLSESLFKKLASYPTSSDGQALDIMTYFKTKQGEVKPVRLVLQYLHPENIEPRFIFMARDISERLKAQAEIQASLEEARAANTELESFSYSISHDLRAPLRSIDGFSHLLMHDYGHVIDEEGKYFINRVRKNAQHMGLLIDDLLTLSQVNRGELNREICNLSEMANYAVRKLQDIEPDRSVAVDILPGIFGWVDKPLFQNLLDNLFGNAWKYTGKTEEPRIEFGYEMREKETVYYVRDNGAGFDMKYADKLFHAFQRLHADKEFTGTGIGLATVSRILCRHGGRVWAVAETGKGATFYFTLEEAHRLPKEKVAS